MLLPQLLLFEEWSMEDKLILTRAEIQLIELVRSLDYGELRIQVRDSRPVRVEEIRRSIQLNEGK